MERTIRKSLFSLLAIGTILALVSCGQEISTAPDRVALTKKAGNVKLGWSPGWDDLTKPLDFAHSFVNVNNPDKSSNLRVVYSLKGARPNTSHNVGLHLFWDSTSQCIPNFGQFPRFNCFFAVRQSFGSVVQGHNLGVLTTDSEGNGNLTVLVKGIAPGTYEIQFDVSTTTCNSCARIYQSPGPTFGGTHSVTIP